MEQAVVLNEEQAQRNDGVCSRCRTPLGEENTSEWSLLRGICIDCVRGLGGGRMDDPLLAFLVGGYIMFTHGQGIWRIRVEVRSRSRTDLMAIKHMLGGTVYQHSKGPNSITWRWAASAKPDVHKIGQVLMQYQPQLGMLLTQYVAQPSTKVKSAFAQACAAKFGTRTIRILEFLDVDGSDGGLGKFRAPPQEGPVKEA